MSDELNYLPDIGFLDDETLYHINITDYLGNIRVVDNLHQVQESNNYEPFGVEMQISDVSENIQPYKDQGKEYISTNHAKFHSLLKSSIVCRLSTLIMIITLSPQDVALYYYSHDFQPYHKKKVYRFFPITSFRA